MNESFWRAAGRILRDVLRASTKSASRTSTRAPRSSTPTPRSGAPAPHSNATADYPGDFQGTPRLTYAPHEGRLADPGEIAWTWVPYEEDATKGKDRPVLIIGRDSEWLLALPLTSKDHDRDAAQEASVGRYWCDIGTGPWDRQGRASEVRVNRIVRIAPDAVRRVSGRLDKERFDMVADEVLRHLN